MNNSMISPSIIDLLEKVEDRYTLVTVVSKRARQLIQGEEYLIETEVTKPVTVAINEIDQDKITYEKVKEGIK